LYDFLSTAPPPVPNIEYVLPTFEWQFEKSSRVRKQTRRCGLAVMLNRPWFASGDGEMLAVVLPPANQCKAGTVPSRRSLTLTLPSQYPPYGASSLYGVEQQVTAWGTHAIWPSVENANMSISLRNAVRCEPVVIQGQAFSVALFEPNYDEVEQKWYCNLSFSEAPVYGTLMRLALARYQPHSIVPDKSTDDTIAISDIVTTEFALLNPTRVLQVKRKGGSLEVTIIGVGVYDEKGQLQTRFDVRLATETEDAYVFPWREADAPSSGDKPDSARQILFHGLVKFDHLKTNAIVVREYESFPVFESDCGGGGKATSEIASREKLVYATSVEIRPSIF
jgi:hypothetical protein